MPSRVLQNIPRTLQILNTLQRLHVRKLFIVARSISANELMMSLSEFDKRQLVNTNID